MFDGLTRLLSQEVHHQTTNQEQDWLVFSEQLRREMDGVRLTKVENHHLYVDKDGQSLAFGLSKKDDFRKTNGQGKGYQPMLYGLSSAEMSQENQRISIHFVFQNGLERTFVYDFTEAG